MSSSNFVPRKILDFNLWQNNLIDFIEQNLTTWGITEEDFAALKTIHFIWVAAFEKTSNKNNRTPADVLAKNEAYSYYEGAIRPFVAKWISKNNKVTYSDRVLMGLSVKSGAYTPKPIPTTRPMGTIDFSRRLQHTLNFTDATSPFRKAKPEGVHGCEIYMKVDGDAPTNASDLNYIGTCTATPHVITFDRDKTGKIAYYMLRWVNTRGQCGPWSIVVSAMMLS